MRAIDAGIAERPDRVFAIRPQIGLDAALGAPELELGEHRPAELAELHRLGAQLDLRIDPREVEQVGRQPAEPPGLRPGPVEQRAGVLDVRRRVVKILAEQLEHPVERGERGAQLVRGGGDERAARLLLDAQLLLHGMQRAGEVADLVGGVVDGHDHRRVARGIDRRLAQPPQPPHQPRRQRDAEQQRERERGERGIEERAAHDMRHGRGSRRSTCAPRRT